MPEFDMTGLMPDLESEEEQAAPLQSTMGEAMKVEPDTHAKNLDISKSSGVPVELVAKDPKGIQAASNSQNFDMTGLMKRSPKTSEFMTDFDQASIAHDDTANLEGIEKLLNLTLYGPVRLIQKTVGMNALDNFHKTLPKVFRGANLGAELESIEYIETGKYVDEIKQAQYPRSGFQSNPVLASMRASAQNVTPEQLAYLEQSAEITEKKQGEILEDLFQNRKELQSLTPKGLSIMGQGLRSGLESTAVLLPALLAAGATKTGAPLVITWMSLQSKATAYGEGRMDGLEPPAARIYSDLAGLIEGVTESLPVGALVKMMGRSIASGFGRQAVKFMIKEMGTEQLATLSESFLQYKFGLDKEMEKALSSGSMMDVAALQGERQAITFFASIVGGGAQLGIASTVSKTAELMQSDSEKLQTKYQKEQVTIDQLAEMAEESKLKERSPEKFKQFIEGVVGKDLNVHLDAVQASLYLQEVGQEVVDGDTFLTGIQKKLQGEALLTGDISVPVSEFMTDIAGSDHFQALRSATTLSSETLAMVDEKKAEGAQNIESQVHMRKVVEVEANKVAKREELKDVITRARAQLVATGRHDESTAADLATAVAGYIESVGARDTNVNETLQKIYTKMGLKVEGEVNDEAASTKIVLPPSAFTSEQDLSGISLTTDNGVTIDAQRVWKQTNKRRDLTNKLMDCLNS